MSFQASLSSGAGQGNLGEGQASFDADETGTNGNLFRRQPILTRLPPFRHNAAIAKGQGGLQGLTTPACDRLMNPMRITPDLPPGVFQTEYQMLLAPSRVAGCP